MVGLTRRDAAFLLGAGALAIPATARAADQDATPLARGRITTSHAGVFNGQHVTYDAIVEPIDVALSSGAPGARIVSTSYIARTRHGQANRPVLFAFNGGPIAASAALHMGLLGPKRVAIPDDVAVSPDTYQLVDNPHTLLDIADIVFFDPAGTGFSRVAAGVEPQSYFSVSADAQQCAQFVVEWSRLHGRLQSPKYALGESYGTMRAAALANHLQKITPAVPLNGIALLGQALNIIEFSQRPANIISYVVSLPTLTALALHHRKATLGGKTYDAFLQEVFAFAQSEYLDGLFKGQRLDETTRRTLAQKLETYTGIPAAYYLANRLRISKERYRRELFKNEGRILGQSDARYIGPAPAPGQAGDPASVISNAYDRFFKSYLQHDLDVADAAEYRTDSPVEGLDNWDWGHGSSPFSDWPYPTLVSEVFEANPHFRVLVGNGYHDTQTTVGAAKYLCDQAGWPDDRTTLRFYQGGHMTYSTAESLAQISADLRNLVQTV